MISKGIYPLIPEKGSVGASGDCPAPLISIQHLSYNLDGLGPAPHQCTTLLIRYFASGPHPKTAPEAFEVENLFMKGDWPNYFAISVLNRYTGSRFVNVDFEDDHVDLHP